MDYVTGTTVVTIVLTVLLAAVLVYFAVEVIRGRMTARKQRADAPYFSAKAKMYFAMAIFSAILALLSLFALFAWRLLTGFMLDEVQAWVWTIYMLLSTPISIGFYWLKVRAEDDARRAKKQG